jgi:hypothetical protein
VTGSRAFFRSVVLDEPGGGQQRSGTALSAGRGTTAVACVARRLLPALLAAGLATTAATLSVVRPSTASAAGTASVTASPSAIRGASGRAAGVGTATATVHARRTVSAGAGGSATTAATLHARYRVATSADGASTTTVTITRLADTRRTATADGIGTATATVSAVRAVVQQTPKRILARRRRR